ncbi:MAG TPA: hypothetical protein VJ824_03440 [Bacillota bacterium]|nr:hypothetical protein [Bacillota bacterium]
MKVSYPLKTTVELKVIKEVLKPFGGRCAKVNEGVLEYQIKDEQEKAAHDHLKEIGYID